VFQTLSYTDNQHEFSMMRIWAQPLRRQSLIALLLMVVPVLAAAGWLGFEQFQENKDELAEQTRVMAARAGGVIERELAGLDRMAVRLSRNPVFQKMEGAAAEPLLRLQTVPRPWLIELALVNRDGEVIARGRSSSEGLEELSTAPVLIKHGRHVSPMELTSSGAPSVIVTYPITDGSTDGSDVMVGTLAAYVNTQLLQETVSRLALPPDSIVTLTEPDGRILGRNLESERYVGLVLDVSWFPGEPPAGATEDADGIQRVYSRATVAGGPWILTVGMPTSLAMNRAISLSTGTIPVLAFVLGSWLLVVFAFSRRLTASVAHLERAAQRIASGDFSPVERRPMAAHEFAQLQNAFDHMLSRFNERRAALDGQMTEERRMRQEVQSLQRQVIRQERLAAVGQLVSGVAHEINNPLQAILGFAELLQMQGGLPESVKNDLILIQKESARACGIIRNLALFARQQTGEAAPVRLADVITSVVELRQRRLETEDIELRIEDDSQQHVLAVLTELQQVVLNFVVNAEQAIVMSGRHPGRITLRTRDEGDRVILEVEDTGPGIPPENEAKLFQPFFTTKPVGQGTGLGLSVSYGIIDSLGGHLGYRSASAGGAIFHFDLPAAAE
jgi:signal transduction histidine kinase